METSPFLSSPMAQIVRNGVATIRRKLCDPECPDDFPAVAEFRAEGFTDYVAAELIFGDGSRQCVSFSTRVPGGFTDHDLAQFESVRQVLALVLDSHNNRALSSTLLNTYLGNISGGRVLDGQIRRGDGDIIDAIVWFSDLRESTVLTKRLGREAFLQVLNEYFDATAGAVIGNGGEVLRFIGDASLAVFPVTPGEVGFTAAVTAAMNAAKEAMHQMDVLNADRHRREVPVLGYGIALNAGEVLFGNIGTATRLEFSVIGAAANEAARMETLCKTEQCRLVVSERIARATKLKWRHLGSRALRGVEGGDEYFGLS